MRRRVGTARLVRALVMLAALVAGVGAAACDVVAPGDAPASPSASQAAERRLDAEEFEKDLNDSVALVEQYWYEQFAAARLTFQPVRRIIPYRRDGEVSCGDEPVPRNNAVYCPTGDFIAYDVNWAADAFNKIGDAFLFFLLGHEYAHAVQVRFGIRYSFTIQQELQADCLAGAWMGDSVRSGRLLIEEGDAEELYAGLVAVSDDPGQPWFAPNAHGNAQQRTTAFFSGYRHSLPPCGLRP